VNSKRLAALTTPIVIYTAADVPGINSKGYKLNQVEATESLNRNTIWVPDLAVKVGAMVMLVTVSPA
jgi:hypothetical protein